MMHPFCMATKANTNEEYKKILKKRMNKYLLLSLLGLLTIAALTFNTYFLKNTMNDHLHSFYLGLGCGLVLGGVGLWFKTRHTLSDDKLLKESRIKNTDERIQEISSIAMRMATIALLVTTYIVCLIGGLIFPTYMPILSKVLLAQVSIFLVGYSISFQIYNKKM